MPVGAALDPRAEAKLMLHMRRPSAAKARGLALAAIRETFEETGLLLGSKRESAPVAPPGPWTAFAEASIHPDLSTVHFIARAITPPRRKRRYDTRFFTADVSAIAHKIEGKVGPDAELIELVWLPLDGIKEKIELWRSPKSCCWTCTSRSRPVSATTCRCRSTGCCMASGCGSSCEPFS
jgi:8-oxo-dGTP pyrophosphatase MutT (NUDIX family)